MDSIGDIIYFLVLIVIAVAGMFGKKNKAHKEATQKNDKVPDTPSDPWEELERQLRRKVTQPIPEPATPEPKPVVSQSRPVYKTETHKDSAETIFSSQREPLTREYISYDTVDDVSRLRVKKQIKESIFKKQTALKTTDLGNFENDSYTLLPEIEFDNIEEVKKAFIYSEIFNRKYS